MVPSPGGILEDGLRRAGLRGQNPRWPASAPRGYCRNKLCSPRAAAGAGPTGPGWAASAWDYMPKEGMVIWPYGRTGSRKARPQQNYRRLTNTPLPHQAAAEFPCAARPPVASLPPAQPGDWTASFSQSHTSDSSTVSRLSQLGQWLPIPRRATRSLESGAPSPTRTQPIASQLGSGLTCSAAARTTTTTLTGRY